MLLHYYHRYCNYVDKFSSEIGSLFVNVIGYLIDHIGILDIAVNVFQDIS